MVAEILEAIEDARTPIRASLQEKDVEKKEAMRAELATETIPYWLRLFEARAVENGSNGCICGPSLTIVRARRARGAIASRAHRCPPKSIELRCGSRCAHPCCERGS